MKPLKFNRIRVEALWGYEDWILSSIEGRESILISNESDSNESEFPPTSNETSSESSNKEQITLNDLIKNYKEKLVGKKVFEKFGYDFPILIKFINTHDKLSVQVHPSDATAEKINLIKKKNGEKDLAKGKTEMWYITEAKENAHLLLGFSKPITPDKFEQLVKKSIESGEDLEDIFQKIIVKKGEGYFVPAGSVHAIGANIELIEIQQSSNTTYRIFDYNRKDKNGELRPLNLKEAMLSIDWNCDKDCDKNCDKKSKSCTNISSQYFSVKQIIINDSNDLDKIDVNNHKMSKDSRYLREYVIDGKDLDSFSVIVVTEGMGTLSYYPDNKGVAKKISFKKGELYFLPAALGKVTLKGDKSVRLLQVHL